MRPWASWTAKTALLAAGFAAAGGGLSGVALAGTGGGVTAGSAITGGVIQSAVAPVASALGVAGPLTGLVPLSGLAPLSAVTGSRPATLGIIGAGGTPAPGSGSDPALVTRLASVRAQATRTFRPRPSWPDSGSRRASRTCLRWPV